jgi:thiamine monophosphate kinase
MNTNDINTQLKTDDNTHLFTNDNFQQLIIVTDTIYQQTHVKPSIKKLVNLIIEQTDLGAITQWLIAQYS